MPDAENSSDELAVFQAYVDLINSARDELGAQQCAAGREFADPRGDDREPDRTVWATGAHSPAARRRFPRNLGLGGDHHRGVVLDRHVKIAATLSSPCFAQLPNPFSKGASHNHTRGAIFFLTLLMIAVFALIYLLLGLFEAFRLTRRHRHVLRGNADR